MENNNIWLKKILFGLVAFIAVFSSEVALVIGTSKFLSNGLINLLPMVLLMAAFGVILNYTINGLLSKKMGAAGSLTVNIILELILIGITFYFQNDLAIFLLLALFVARLANFVYDTSVNNLAGSFSSARQSKDFLPFIRGIMDIGILCSSLYLYFLTGVIDFDPLWIIFVGGILMIILIQIIALIFKPVVAVKSETENTDIKKTLTNLLYFVRNGSVLFKVFCFYGMVIGGATMIFVMVYNQGFSLHLSGNELTIFIGKVSLITVLARGLYILFLHKKANSFFGMFNMIIVYSLGLVVILTMMLFSPENLWLVSALYFFHVFSFYSYWSVSIQQIFKLSPQNLDQSLFFLIRGFIPGIFALVGAGLAGLVAYWFPGNIFAMIVLMFMAESLLLFLAVRMKKDYQLALEGGLISNDEYIKGGAVDLAGEPVQWEKAEKGLRKLVVNENESIVMRQKAIYSLVEIGNPNSICDLLLVLHKEKNLRMKFYSLQSINQLLKKMEKVKMKMNVTEFLILQAVNEIYEQDLPSPLKVEANNLLQVFGFEVLLEFYKRNFAKSNNLIKTSILEALSANDDRGLITLLEPLMDDPDLHVRSEVIIGLWKFAETRTVLMQKIREIAENKSDEARLMVLKIIGRLKLRFMEDYVVDMVALNNRDISLMAIITALIIGKNPAYILLKKKLITFAQTGDHEGSEYILKKLYLLPNKYKEKLITEIRSMNDDTFERLKEVYNKSNEFFDWETIRLFTT